MRTLLTSAVLAAVSTFLLNSPQAQAQDTTPCVIAAGVTTIAPNPNPRGAPFSAVIKSTFDQKLADGNSIHIVIRYRVARDAFGKTFTERPGSCYPGKDGQQHQSYQVMVYDQNSRTMGSWQVDGTNRTATITHFPAPVKPSEAELAAMRANAALRQRIPASEWQTEKLGTQNFQGVSAEGTRRIQTIPAGEQGNTLPLVVVTENWDSRDIGMSMMSVLDDPRRGRTVGEVEELNQGDPPPSMFTPPEGYEIKEQTQTTTVMQSPTASQ